MFPDLKGLVIKSYAAFQSNKLEEKMSLAKEGLEKGTKEVNEEEL